VSEAATLLVVARAAGERASLRAALEGAGYRVIETASEGDATSVLRSIVVDAMVVQGERELVRGVAEAAGATPWIEVEGARQARAVVAALLAADGDGDGECERVFN